MIKQSLVTGLSPDPLIKQSMNEIKHARYIKEAMSHQAAAGMLLKKEKNIFEITLL